MLVTPGFHHTTMVARDVERTIPFYRDLLGLRMIARSSDADDPEAERLFFTDDDASPGSLISILEWPGARRGRWGVGGIHHVALGVADEAAQLKWKRRLMDAGVPVSGPYDRGWFHSIYFSDPDGQILEIATHGPGYARDEPIDALGQKLAMPNAQQLRGQRDEALIADRTHHEAVREVTPDMKLDGIHHITGLVNDVELMGDFYERALGLRLVKRSVNQDDPSTPHLFWANYDGTRVAKRSSLTMFGWPRSDYKARAGTGQTHHIAFRANSEDELNAWQEQLRALNVETTDVLDRVYYRSLYFHAPDGLLMEIASDAEF